VMKTTQSTSRYEQSWLRRPDAEFVFGSIIPGEKRAESSSDSARRLSGPGQAITASSTATRQFRDRTEASWITGPQQPTAGRQHQEQSRPRAMPIAPKICAALAASAALLNAYTRGARSNGKSGLESSMATATGPACDVFSDWLRELAR